MQQSKPSLRDRLKGWRKGENRRGTATPPQGQSPANDSASDPTETITKADSQHESQSKGTEVALQTGPVVTTTIEQSSNTKTRQPTTLNLPESHVGSSEIASQFDALLSNTPVLSALGPQDQGNVAMLKPVDADGRSMVDESSALWQEAFEELRKDNPTLVEHYEVILKAETGVPQNYSLHDQMAAIATTQANRASNKQWRFQWSGKQQSVRDVAGRILDLTSNAADLVAIGMSFAPPYVSVPWAAAATLVSFMVNDIKEHNSALEGLEIAAKIVLRYQLAEGTFLGGEDTRDVYKKNVMPLYKKILEYQALATRYFGQSTLRRIGKNVLGSSEWQDMPAELSVLDSETRYTLQFLGQQTQLASLVGIMDVLKRQDEQIGLLTQRTSLRRDETEKAAKLISTIAVDRDHKDVRKKLGEAHSSSGNWFLEHPDVQAWNSWDEDCRVLWLRDGVGTGKSSLTSILVENLMRSADGVVAFFYCSRKRDLYDEAVSARDDGENVMRSLVAQVANSPDGLELSDVIVKRFDRSRRRAATGIDLSTDDCTALIGDILSSSKSRCTIVVDALDECTDHDGLLQNLNEATAAHSHVRLFFSSRLQVKVRDHMPHARIVSIQTRNAADIVKFLDIEMTRRRIGSGMTDAQCERLRKILVERADSMFMWVKLQLNLFLHEIKSRRIRFEEDIEPMLVKLEMSQAHGEEQLYIAYDDVYNTAVGLEAEKRRKEVVITALRWVLCAYRTLTLRELTYATLVLPDGSVRSNVQEGLLLELCSNLIVEDTVGAVRLAHLSVRHFLETRNPPEYCTDLNHQQAALSCLYFTKSPRYQEIASSRVDRLQDGDITLTREFYTYVASNWFKHCKNARKSEDLDVLIDSFASKNIAHNRMATSTLESAIEANISTLATTGISPTSARANMITNKEPSLMKATNVCDRTYGAEIFAIMLAVLDGTSKDRMSAITRFIAKGFDLDISNQFGDTVLHEAIRFWWQDVTRVLLDSGASADTRNVHGDTPLHLASIHRNTNGTRELLHFGADVNARNSNGETALHLAIINRAFESAEDLLAAGADALAKDHNDNTPIHLATLTGNRSFLETLLLSGYNPNARNGMGQSALMIAIELRLPAIVTLLLENDALVTADEISLAHSIEAPEMTSMVSKSGSNRSKKAEQNVSDETLRQIYEASVEYKGCTTLCNHCDPVRWISGLRRGMAHRHHESLKDLYASAKYGCAMCNFLVDELTKVQEPAHTSREGFLTVTVEATSVQVSQSHPHDRLVLSIQGTDLLDFELCADTNNTSFPAAQWLTGRILDADPRDERCLDMAKNWVKTCVNEHSECGAQEPSPLPTRLIDVGSGPDSKVRLVTTRMMDRDFYVYLSWRWGSGATTRHLLELQEALCAQDGCDSAQLSQTHQDAILITRRLGFRYIWIDAYCIVQGSPEDFQVEAPRMNQYFQNAAFVLVAAGSTSFTDSLLRVRPQPLLTINFTRSLEMHRDLSDEPTSHGRVYLRDPVETAYQSLQESALSRGWMVSEVIVPSRLLIIGSDQIYWNCRTHALSEGSILQREPVLKLVPRDLSPITFRGQRAFLPWYGLVQMFSGTFFHHQSDRTVAVLAIARHFDDSADLLEGLWPQDLRNGLLWHVDGGASNGRRPSSSTPSWSWAHVAAPVRYDFLHGAHHSSGPLEHAFNVVEIFDIPDDAADDAQDLGRWRRCLTIDAVTLDTTSSSKMFDDCMYFPDNITYERAWQQRSSTFLLVFFCPWSMTTDLYFDPNRARGLGLVLCQTATTENENQNEHQEVPDRESRQEFVKTCLSDLDFDRGFVRAGLFLTSSSYDQSMQGWTRRRVVLM